jgi:hypothetical protein
MLKHCNVATKSTGQSSMLGKIIYDVQCYMFQTVLHACFVVK